MWWASMRIFSLASEVPAHAAAQRQGGRRPARQHQAPQRKVSHNGRMHAAQVGACEVGPDIAAVAQGNQRHLQENVR